MRAALSQPPTFQTLELGRDAYMRPLQLRELTNKKDGHSRFWSFHSVPTTVALSGNRFAKSLYGFHDHENEDDFRGLLDEYSTYNCPRPSGYADVFHECYTSPRVPWSVNAPFASCLAGGWQDAIAPGIHKGTYYKYDIRSAYLWAATLGMPDPTTYTRSLSPGGKNNGIYRLRLIGPEPSAPFPFNYATECIATNSEIELYNLRIETVLDGLIWKQTLPGEPIVNAVCKVSTWKQAARCYWGRWGQVQKVTCCANGKTWQLPNVLLNIPWAALIIARIKMRLWEFSKNAVHVYVDSIITPDKLITGDKIGDWRLERSYDGVFIRGPGQYGKLNAPTLEKMAGCAKDSPLRRNPPTVEEDINSNWRPEQCKNAKPLPSATFSSSLYSDSLPLAEWIGTYHQMATCPPLSS